MSTVFFWTVVTSCHRSIRRTPSTYTLMPSSASAVSVKGPPEPKSRVRDQRTPKSSGGRATPAGSPVP